VKQFTFNPSFFPRGATTEARDGIAGFLQAFLKNARMSAPPRVPTARDLTE
jgi:hypothetical protein